jgi:hypothetical protein
MASNIPEQERTVDPFSSYGSDVVNQLTRMVTRVTDQSGWLNGPNDLDVISDGTSNTTAIVTTGIIFKDDMQIFITDNFTVDFHDTNHYFNPTGGLMNETGYYYVTLEYAFVKSRPAPQARIKIIRPSERATSFTNSNLTFLKAADVQNSGGSNVLTGDFYDYDPDDTSVARISIQQFASTEIFLPTFNRLQHQGKILYVKSTDTYYYGGETGWTFAGNALTVNQTITAPGDWTLDGGSYRADVDITTLNTMNCVVSVRRDSDDRIISPSDIEFTSATNVRIWMPVDTVTVHVTVVA